MKQSIFLLKSLFRKPFVIPFTRSLFLPHYNFSTTPMDPTPLKRKHSELSDTPESETESNQNKNLNSPEKSEKSEFSEKNSKKAINAEKNEKTICLQGLDTFSDEKKLLKFLKSGFPEDIKYEGIMKKKGKSFAFISFESLEDKTKFETHVNTNKIMIKNKKLTIKPAKTKGFQSFKKIHAVEKDIEKNSNRVFTVKKEDIDSELAISIQKRVCPLWKTPYQEQIEGKKKALENILKLINNNAKKSSKSDDHLPKWLKGDKCCEIEDFIASENNEKNPIFYYRNKAELTVGKNHEGKLNVGFNRGNFNKGIMWVEEAHDCPIISKEAIQVSIALQDYIRGKHENLQVFDRFNHVGFWRNIVIRQSNITKEILISIVVCDKEIEKPLLESIKSDLKDLLLSLKFPLDFKIVGILMLYHNEISDNIPYNCRNDIIYGVPHYTEIILGKAFQISPDSFLQVNIPQCENLYSLIGKIADVDEKTIFLDICSGIGTIGICLADKAKQIVAIEVVESACQDSLKNAQNNKVTNFSYHCAKVEDILEEAIKPYIGQGKIVGVLDPPRAGLHASVIRKLRTCKGLDKLVYVSCNPTAMVDNLMGLCLPMNKNRKGPPFTPVKCFGVDLFPLTEHYECVMVLERLYDSE